MRKSDLNILKTKQGPGGTAAIYCRVSSAQQKERHTISSQRRILPALAHREGLRVHEIYVDDGISGEKLGNMPALGRLLEAAERRDFDHLLLIDIDRITRFTRESEKALVIDILTENNIKILTPEGRYNLRDRSDRLQFGIKGTVALYEKQTISDRCQRGRDEKKRQGQWLGGTPPAGYMYDKNEKRLKLSDQADEIRSIMQAALNHSARDISRRFPAYSPRMIRRLLEPHRLLFYTGKIKIEGEKIKAQWPPIINDDLAEKIQLSKCARNARGGKTTQSNHLLTGIGLLRCGYCKLSLKSWTDKKTRKSGKIYEKSYYRCVSVQGIKRKCEKSRMIRAEDLEEKILDNVKKTLSDEKALIQAFESYGKKQNNNNMELSRLSQCIEIEQKKKNNLIDAIEKGIIDLSEVKDRLNDAKEKIEGYKREVKELNDKTSKYQIESIPHLLYIENDFLEMENQKTFLTQVIENIKVFNNYLIIEYRFPVTPTGKFTKRSSI